MKGSVPPPIQANPDPCAQSTESPAGGRHDDDDPDDHNSVGSREAGRARHEVADNHHVRRGVRMEESAERVDHG
jgi:hypothetical protein